MSGVEMEWYTAKGEVLRLKNNEPDHTITQMVLVESSTWEQAETKAIRCFKNNEYERVDSKGNHLAFKFLGLIGMLCIGKETPSDGSWVWTE